MDRLTKSVSNIKQYYGGDTSETETMPMATKTERQECCKVMADCILSNSVKSKSDYSALLGITLETLSTCCQDSEADVRIAAEESINRIIKGTEEIHFAKVLIEFYKEIKRNGSSRSLRAALSRFSNLAHRIRPSKGRPFIVSLMPAFVAICAREDESVQECLSVSIAKIFPLIGSFASETEVQNLVSALMNNLQHNSAAIRRNSATCIYEVIKNSNKKLAILSNSVSELLVSFSNGNMRNIHVLGTLTTLRFLVSLFSSDTKVSRRTGSFGSDKGMKIEINFDSMIVDIFELCTHLFCSDDANIVTASLETLYALLKLPSDVLAELFSMRSISKSDFSVQLFKLRASLHSKSATTSTMSSPSRHAPKREMSTPEVLESLNTTPSGSMESSDIEAVTSQLSNTQLSQAVSTDDVSQDIKTSKDAAQSEIVQELANYGAVPEESIEEVDRIDNGSVDVVYELDIDEPYSSKVHDLYSDTNPVETVTRLLCERILKIGSEGTKDVRVSAKNLALSCLGAILKLQPQIMFLSIIENDTPLVADLVSYRNFYDPQIRGCTLLSIAQYVTSALVLSKGNYVEWLSQSCEDSHWEVLSLENLADILCYGLKDDSTVCVRATLQAISMCLSGLMKSSYAHLSVRLLSGILELKDTTYWLVKVDILDVFSNVNFRQVLFAQETARDVEKLKDFASLNTLHWQILELGFDSLGDKDPRVRTAASTMLVSSVSNFGVIIDSVDCDMATSEVAIMCNEFSVSGGSPATAEITQKGSSKVKNLLKTYKGYEKMEDEAFASHNLSHLVGRLVELVSFSTSKSLTQGAIQTLLALSNKYVISKHPTCYDCQFVEDATLTEGKRQLTGLLPMLLSMLESSWPPLEINAHVSVLNLAGNYIAGIAFHGFQIVGANPKTTEQDTLLPAKSSSDTTGSMSAILDSQVGTLASRLLGHILKLLSMAYNIISDTAPALPNKSVLQTLQTGPSLPNTLKKKEKGDAKEVVSAGEQKTHKKTASGGKVSPAGEDNEKEKSGKSTHNSPFNYAHSRVYMKIHDTISGAFETYKTTLDSDEIDKFSLFLQTILDSFCQILELITFEDIEKYTEDILMYLKVIFTVEPSMTVQAVQQLLKGLFGTNLVSQLDLDEQIRIKQPPASNKDQQHYKASFYHQVFHRPLNDFTMAIANASFHHYLQQENTPKAGSGWFGSIKKKVEKKLTLTAKRSKGDKMSIQNYIRLFESVVIKSLKNYTMTSSAEFQKHVLNLLAQLVQLRVNYCLLDSDQIFIGFIIKQFESIEGGLVRNSEVLIPHVFFFLVLLSYEKNHSKSVITMPKIIQLCDGVMASGCNASTHVIPALLPIVHDLFVLRAGQRQDNVSDLDTQREVAQSMLFRIIENPEVLSMVTTILRYYRKENPEQWKKYSRQVTDVLLPKISHQKLDISAHSDVSYLHSLFEALSPTALRPIDLVLSLFFMLPTDLKSLAYHQRWMLKIVALLRVLLCHLKEDFWLQRVEEMQINPLIFSINALLSLQRNPENFASETENLERGAEAAPLQEEVLSRIFIQIIGTTIERIVTENYDPMKVSKQNDLKLLAQLLGEFILAFTYICRSGSFKRLTSATKSILSIPEEQSDPNYYSADVLCTNFYLASNSHALLPLLWSQLLTCVGYTDLTTWGRYTGRSSETTSTSIPILSEGMLHRGTIIMLADYISQNPSEVEAMSWLIVNHIKDILSLHNEPPIQDFVSAIHRSAPASGLFIESIRSLLSSDNRVRVSLKHRILYSTAGLHLKQSEAVLSLLLSEDWFVFSPILSVSEYSDHMACTRLEMMLGQSHRNGDAVSNASLLSHLEELEPQLNKCRLVSRLGRIVALVNRLKFLLKNGVDDPKSIHDGEPVQKNCDNLPKADKAWFKSVAMSYCNEQHSGCDLAKVLNVLDYDDILEVLSDKKFSLRHLQDCLSFAIKDITRPEDATARYANDVASPLLKSTLEVVTKHLNSFVEKLPELKLDLTVHDQISTFDIDPGSSSPVSDYWRNIFLFFEDEHNQTLVQILSDTITNCLSWKHFIQQPFQDVVAVSSKLFRFSIACHEYLLWSAVKGREESTEVKQACLELFNQAMHRSEFQKVFYATENIFFAMVIANSLYGLDSAASNPASQALVSMLSEKSTATFTVVKACRLLDKAINGSLVMTPPVLVDPFQRSLQLLLCHPFFNKLARIPSLLFKDDFTCDDIKALAEEPAAEYLQDKDTLHEYIGRINAIGWITRMQFEETWTTLLGVLVSQPIGDISQNATPVDETAVQISCLTISALTSLVVNSSMKPQGGQPGIGAFQNIPRCSPAQLPDNKIGHDLRVLRYKIEKELEKYSLGSEPWQEFERRQLASNCLQVIDSAFVPYDVFRSFALINRERRGLKSRYYGIGQRSVKAFRILHSISPVDEDVSTVFSSEDDDVGGGTSSDDSEDESELPVSTEMRIMTPASPVETRSHPEAVDVHSCIQFLIDLFSEWFRSASTISPTSQQSGNAPLHILRLPRQFLCECIKSLILVSDFFAEKQQFEWMFNALNSLQSVQPAEDDVMLQYLVLGMSKAGAILGLNKKVCEILSGMMESSFNSSLISCHSFALYGALYILETELHDYTKHLVNIISKYVTERFKIVSARSILHSQQLLHNIIAVGFYLIEKAQVFLTMTHSKVFIHGIVTLLSTENINNVPNDLYVLLMRSLETLITSYSLSASDCDAIAKLASEQFINSTSPVQVLASLKLLVTCMYFRMLRTSETASSADDAQESKLLSMERLTLLFNKIKSGFSLKSSILVQILPVLLDSFFTTQDMMNKVIGEFVSILHPYPEIVAEIMHGVFQNLHSRGESMIVSEWVMLSLGNFTQRKPLSRALWCLTCIFVSASTNHWINSLLPVVLTQSDLTIDEMDFTNFYISAKDFYLNQLAASLDRRSFIKIFKSVAEPGNPYQNVLDMIDKLGIVLD